jgi:hypothetical protein
MSKRKVAFIKTANSLIVNVDGQSHTFHKESPYYEDVAKALKERAFDEIPNLIDLSKKVKVYSEGHFEATSSSEVLVDGKPVVGLIGKRIFEFMQEGLPYEPLLNFVRRVRKNPSYSAQTRLYECLEHNHHPILEDGRFLAYKAVRSDFKDKRKGVFDNSPGRVCEMPREEVDDNHNKTCSTGLHVSSFEYAQNFGHGNDKLIDCAVCPADVVAIPYDYNNQKMRTCKYEVIRESEGYEIKNKILNYSDSSDEILDGVDCDYCYEDLKHCSCEWCIDCGEHEDYCDCDDHRYCSDCEIELSPYEEGTCSYCLDSSSS